MSVIMGVILSVSLALNVLFISGVLNGDKK